MADWSAPIGMERITSILLVHSHPHASCLCCEQVSHSMRRPCILWLPMQAVTQDVLALPMFRCMDINESLLVQPGSMEGQLGALRRVCFGELGFVEQLDALDDEKKLL